MRHSFNTTADFFHGSAGPFPLAFIGTFACRLVVEDAIFFVGSDSPVRFGYITIADHIPRGAWSSPEISLNVGFAETVAVPSGTSQQFFVLQTESVLWRTQPIYYRAHVCFLLEDVPLIGEITYIAYDVLPAGWLDCDGSQVSRTTYAALFALIGTTWGPGDGMTSFNLPDLRDRCLVGKSPGGLAGSRPTAQSVGNSGGEEQHQLAKTEMPIHDHPSFSTDTTSASAGIPYADANIVLTGATANFSHHTGAEGGADLHNNMQPFAVARAIIKF